MYRVTPGAVQYLLGTVASSTQAAGISGGSVAGAIPMGHGDACVGVRASHTILSEPARGDYNLYHSRLGLDAPPRSLGAQPIRTVPPPPAHVHTRTRTYSLCEWIHRPVARCIRATQSLRNRVGSTAGCGCQPAPVLSRQALGTVEMTYVILSTLFCMAMA